MNICSKCKKELQDGIQVCDNCGTLLVGDEKDSGSEQTVKKKSLLVPVLIGAGTLVLLIVIGAFFIIKSGVSEKKETEWTIKKELYVKDEELFVSDMPGKKGMRLTSELLKGKDGDMKEWYSTDYNKISYSIDITDDNKRVFFPDKFDGKSYTLYYNDTGKSSKEKVKIDSDLSEDSLYFVSSDGNIVTYFKEDDSELYQYNISKNEKTKIDSDLGSGLFSIYLESEGNEVYYIKEGGDLYLKKAGKDKEKIDDDVEEILASNLVYDKDETSGVFYLKEGNVYKKEDGKEKEKLVSDVDNVARTYLKQNSFYYTKEKEGSAVLLMDYVEDDMKEQDADIEDPGDEPKYPSLLDYGSVAAYQKAVDEYNEAYDEYLKAEDKYEAKRDRDTLRQELKEEEISNRGKTLYYYDGKKENKVSDNFGTLESRTYKKPILVFSVSESKERKKVKLSKIESIYDVYDELGYDYLSTSSGKIAIAIGDKVSDIEGENIKTATISREGNHLYFVTNIKKNKNYGDLYEVKVKNGKLEKAKLYDEDVCYEMIGVSGDSQVLYFKDYKNSEGTLYINKKEVDEDVYSYGMLGNYSSKEIFYYMDYNSDKDKGSLRVYNGKKAKTIAEDVNDFEVFDDGSVMYLYDYSINKNKGDLNYYKNGKNKQVDEDVTAIFHYMDYSPE